jgi:hypothetical protein
MQNPPGHRNNIHGASYREIGVGVVDGSNDPVGPQLVTEDFGSRNGLTPFITGVVYYDLNGNNAYDLGEGIGGVTVDVAGSSYHAVTVNSGGYSVPVPGNGTFAVTFSATNLPNVVTNATVSGNANLKVDLVPAYAPPTVSGPDVAAVGQASHYTCSAVGAATRYEWRQAGQVPFTTVETAAPAFDFTPTATGEYQIQVAPMVSGRWLPYGPAKVVTASAAAMSIEIVSVQWLAGPQFRLTFQVSSGTTPSFQLEKKDQVNGTWGADSAAILATLVPGSQYQFTTPATAPTPGQRFYRVRSGP